MLMCVGGYYVEEGAVWAFVGVSLVSMETFEVVQHPFVVVLGHSCHCNPKS